MSNDSKEVNELLAEATEYVAVTQPILDKQAAANESFCDSLSKTAENLVNFGLLAKDKKEDFISKSAEDHTFVLTYLDRLSQSIGVEDLGASTETTKNAEPADDFERLYAPEVSKADTDGQLL